jgi:hypothetical protein
LLICSPFFKSYAFEQISNRYNLAELNQDFKLDILIRGQLEDFINGSTDISALESLIQLKLTNLDKVRRVTNLHMKAYLIDEEYLLIGSGNFTKSGLFFKGNSGNIEGAIRTDDKNVIGEFSKYYKEICSAGETLDIFYDIIVKEYEAFAQKFGPKVGNEIANLLEVDESHARYIISSSADVVEYLSENEGLPISVEDIPQFSQFDDSVYRLPKILLENGNCGMTFDELGEIFRDEKTNQVANKKYGENHAKLAELLDLAAISNERPRRVFLTRLGKRFLDIDAQGKCEILKTQLFRMRIVQDIIIRSSKADFNIDRYLSRFLATTTSNRRKSNIKTIFKVLLNSGVTEVKPVIKKL